jgi:hypothetical protein
MKMRGACHCGGVTFEVDLPDGLDKPVRCNCSMCGMKGAVMVFAPLASIALTAGHELLGTYQFHSRTAKHHFCTRCGIHVYHQRRFDPALYAVNAACLEGISPYDFAAVPVIDGANHPKDTGEPAMQVIGTLRFDRAD